MGEGKKIGIGGDGGVVEWGGGFRLGIGKRPDMVDGAEWCVWWARSGEKCETWPGVIP